MIQNTILTVVLLVIIGCGAQNNPDKEEIKNLSMVEDTPTTVPSSIPSITPIIEPSSVPMGDAKLPESSPSVQPSVVFSPTIESNELPQNMGISFPIVLNKSSNSEFIKDFNEVKEIEGMAFLNLALVSQAMPKILNECAGSISCHFQAENFPVEYNETNITLEKIDFRQFSKKKKYPYVLTITKPFNNDLIDDMNDTISYKWTHSKRDIWTTYTNDESNLSVRYFIDADANESMVINHKKEGESITFMVIQKDEHYHLSSNHLKKDNEDFSTSIFLEDGLLVTENENMIQLSQTSKNIKDGNFAFLPPDTSVKELKLKNILDLTEGTFSVLNKKFQGFLYSDKFLDNLNELTIVELTEEDKGFQLLNEESNESKLSPN